MTGPAVLICANIKLTAEGVLYTRDLLRDAGLTDEEGDNMLVFQPDWPF